MGWKMMKVEIREFNMSKESCQFSFPVTKHMGHHIITVINDTNGMPGAYTILLVRLILEMFIEKILRLLIGISTILFQTDILQNKGVTSPIVLSLDKQILANPVGKY
ncbi:hypothetical protein WA026_012908 [Henosepilachna vigintioctopunctata]|uniref:Uncharacterized protein n=1 Tax=Henosepilachna vigintioctopunctata TaxID=420089 RepID=A0AAW1TLG2_9CUCU